MKYDEDLNIPGIIAAGVFAVLLVIAAIAGLQGLFYKVSEDQRQVKVIDQEPAGFKTLQYEQLTKMSGYEWTSRASGTVGIPIERAMEIVVKEQSGGEGEGRK